MAGQDGAASIQACALRVTRLDANGATPAGASNMILTGDMIKLDVKKVFETGEEFNPKNGCGSIAFAYKDRDKFKRLDLSLTYIRPDPELAEMIEGGTLITSAGQTIGYSAPAVGDSGTDGVCLEVWSKAWVGGAAPKGRTFTDAVTTTADATLTSGSASFTASDVGLPITGTGIPASTTILSVTNSTTIELSANATATATGVSIVIGRPGRYHQWVFPKLDANLTDFVLENAPMQQVFSGPSYENLGIGNGPANDWPSGIVSSRSYSHWRTDTIPTISTIGYQATPTQV